MAKYHEIRIRFLDKRVRSFMPPTAITLKFKLRWFSDEAGYSAEKVYTDINLPPLMSWWLFNFGFKKTMTSLASQEYSNKTWLFDQS